MSEGRNFRITLHLHHFFRDHRTLCKLFINRNFKTILDLKNHIRTIFKLQNEFYLQSQSYYLPDSEDVRILNHDDVITAIPEDPILPEQCYTNECNFTKPIQETAKIKKEKRVKKRLISDDTITNDEAEEVINEHKLKKKQKVTHFKPRASSSLNETEEIKKQMSEIHPTASCPTPWINHTKDSAFSSELANEHQNTAFEKNQSRYKTEMVKKCETFQSSTPNEDKRNKKSNRTVPISDKKVIEPISKLPKSINIIQNIRVSSTDKWEDVASHFTKPLPSDNTNFSNDLLTNKSSISTVNISEISSRSVVSNSLKSQTSDTELSCVSDNSNLVTKRKRIRKRRNKRTESFISPPPYIFKPPNSEVKPILYIKFEDNDNIEKENVKSKIKSVAKIEVSKCNGENSIEIIESTQEDNIQDFNSLDRNTATLEKKDVLQNNLKKGDNIQFKILKLNETYTPIVSNSIFAQVENFDVKSKELDLLIIKGQEEFSQPQGKFALESEEKEGEKTESLYQSLNFNDLIEPQFGFD